MFSMYDRFYNPFKLTLSKLDIIELPPLPKPKQRNMLNLHFNILVLTVGRIEKRVMSMLYMHMHIIR